MRVTVLCVGKLKEQYWEAACAEYLKRLSRYCKTEVLEVADEGTPDGASEAEEAKIRQKEGKRLLGRLEPYQGKAHVIALEIKGKQYDSVAFAEHMDKLAVQGRSHIVFLIGGSLGLHSTVLACVDELLSFSKMTFPHQLMRVILLEQIYRGYRIINHEPYHK